MAITQRHGEECEFRHTTFLDSNVEVVEHRTPCNVSNLRPNSLYRTWARRPEDFDSIQEYVLFAKHVTNDFSARSVDTYRPMALSFVDDLLTIDFCEFPRDFARRHAAKKRAYPYEYTDGWDTLDERSRKAFHISESTVSKEDNACAMWDRFGCRTPGEYSDLYVLKVDVILPTNTFENFWNVCMDTYNIDPTTE